VNEQKINFYVKGFDASKKEIDSISPSFCAAKWLQVSLHLTNGRTHSCYHPPTHSIDLEDLKNNPAALHNTKQKFQERKMMLEGTRPSGCNYCWKIEDAGHISDRYYRSSEHWANDKLLDISKLPYNENISPTYVEVNFNQACNFKCSYCSPHLSSEWEKEIKKFGPYVIDEYDHNDISKLQQINLMPLDVSNRDNPYIQAFWKWWPDIYKDLKVFRMTGGEPLMDQNTFKVLDYVKDNPNKNLELSITSNLCPPKQDLFDKFLEKVKLLDTVEHAVECYVPDPKDGSEWQSWKHYVIGIDQKQYHNSELPSIERDQIPQTFPTIGHALEDGSFTYLYKYHDKACKHFTLFVSLDSVGEHAEYIRNGLNFKTLINNVRRFLKETDNTSVSFINTFNILSIPRLKNFLELIVDLRNEYCVNNQRNKKIKPFQRIWFDIPLLERPDWLSIYNSSVADIENLNKTLDWMKSMCDQEEYQKQLTGFKPYEVEKLERNIKLINDNKYNAEKIIKNSKDFKLFFDEHDRRRGTNFIQSFPELKDWYRNI
jgi:organic radical activating enzyme